MLNLLSSLAVCYLGAHSINLTLASLLVHNASEPLISVI
jgi:hypothetical protein